MPEVGAVRAVRRLPGHGIPGARRARSSPYFPVNLLCQCYRTVATKNIEHKVRARWLAQGAAVAARPHLRPGNATPPPIVIPRCGVTWSGLVFLTKPSVRVCEIVTDFSVFNRNAMHFSCILSDFARDTRRAQSALFSVFSRGQYIPASKNVSQLLITLARVGMGKRNYELSSAGWGWGNVGKRFGSELEITTGVIIGEATNHRLGRDMLRRRASALRFHSVVKFPEDGCPPRWPVLGQFCAGMGGCGPKVGKRRG